MAAKQTVAKYAPMAAAPVLKALLEQFAKLKLLPLRHWEWDASSASVMSYLAATAGAAIGCIWNPRSRRDRTVLIAVGLVVMLASFIAYRWVMSTPPTPQSAWMFDALGYTTFFMTPLAFGFVIARTTRMFGK